MTAFSITPSFDVLQEPLDRAAAIAEAESMADWALRLQLEAGYCREEAVEFARYVFGETLAALGQAAPEREPFLIQVHGPDGESVEYWAA